METNSSFRCTNNDLILYEQQLMHGHLHKAFPPKTDLVAQIFLSWINTIQYIDFILNECRHYCTLGWSSCGKFGKLYGNRVKFVRFRWKAIYAKYLKEKSIFAGCTWAVKLHGSFHPNATSASMGTISDFAQNCIKCTPVGANENCPQGSLCSFWKVFGSP